MRDGFVATTVVSVGASEGEEQLPIVVGGSDSPFEFRRRNSSRQLGRRAAEIRDRFPE
jgi:hypothetical protein